MTWSVLQSAPGPSLGPSVTSRTCTFTGNVAAGTKLICFYAMWAPTAAVTVTVTDAAGNAMTQVGLIYSSANQVQLGILAMDTPSGDVGTQPVITLTPSAASYVAALVQEVSGLAAGNTLAEMIDGTAAAATHAAGASNAQPAYSSTAAGEYLVSFAGDQGGPQTMAQPSGYALDANAINDSGNSDVCPAYKSSTGGAETGTWAYTGSTVASGIMVAAFKLASGGTNTSPAYATAYDIISGGSGSWVNPANAGGAADSEYATWTAP